MDGPWYESQGPDLTYVKNDINNNFADYSQRFPNLTHNSIKQTFRF